MNYIDEAAIRFLRDSARRLLWPWPELGGRFESDEFAQQYITEELRQAIKTDFGNFETAFEIADDIIKCYANLTVTPFQNRPQNFTVAPTPPETVAPLDTYRPSHRPRELRDEAENILRLLPLASLNGKREALLSEVNAKMSKQISKDTLRRALQKVNGAKG